MQDRKILSIDDHPATVEMLKTVLKCRGYQVASTYSGGDGLQAIRSEAPGLILLDLMMPEINGYEVQAQLKVRIPVIIISVIDSEESKKMCFALGGKVLYCKAVRSGDTYDGDREMF